MLYAAFWAGHQVFGVWPVALSFGLMVAIDVMLYGGPGAGLGPRVFASWRL